MFETMYTQYCLHHIGNEIVLKFPYLMIVGEFYLKKSKNYAAILCLIEKRIELVFCALHHPHIS